MIGSPCRYGGAALFFDNRMIGDGIWRIYH
nr:MAG TPA: hypothetical protein [Caudoviricetes sp.]DAT54493.1 MAG TPA: hypothetical protein [Caudoviricetes sp.]